MENKYIQPRVEELTIIVTNNKGKVVLKITSYIAYYVGLEMLPYYLS